MSSDHWGKALNADDRDVVFDKLSLQIGLHLRLVKLSEHGDLVKVVILFYQFLAQLQ